MFSRLGVLRIALFVGFDCSCFVGFRGLPTATNKDKKWDHELVRQRKARGDDSVTVYENEGTVPQIAGSLIVRSGQQPPMTTSRRKVPQPLPGMADLGFRV